MPNQKTICSSGEAWPVFSRSVMNSRIFSWVIFSDLNFFPDFDWRVGGIAGAKRRVEFFQRLLRVVDQLDLHFRLIFHAFLDPSRKWPGARRPPVSIILVQAAVRLHQGRVLLNPHLRFDCVSARHLPDCQFRRGTVCALFQPSTQPISNSSSDACSVLDAEYAHRMTLRMFSILPPFTPPRARPELEIKLWGTDFSNPIGLAAGMDKDAIAIRGWETLGFGFAELGTITPRPQDGNETPRLWRIPERRALINRLGFPSEGMEAVARRIERMRKAGISIRLGLNFGPNSDHAAGRCRRRLRRSDGTARAAGRFHRDQRELAEYAGAAQLAIAGEDDASCSPRCWETPASRRVQCW